GLGVASVGVFVMALLVWIIYRSQLAGRGSIEYLVMFPQAVPRLVFGLALLWAWLNMPIPIYGTLWLLALAYFTVMLPLGVRTLAGVVLQIDKSLEECARVCGAGWAYQMRTVTLPLLKPGILAAWLLIFMAYVRRDEGADVTGSVDRIELSNLVIRYGDAVAVNGVSFNVGRGEHVTLLGPSGCGKTTTLRAIAGLEKPTAGSIRIDGQAMYDAAERRNVPT